MGVLAQYLVQLLQCLVALLETFHHLHLDLSELNVVHHLLEVLHLSVRLLEQALQIPLLLQEELCFPGRKVNVHSRSRVERRRKGRKDGSI